VVPLDSNISAHILTSYRAHVSLDIQCPTRNPYLLVQESLAHGPVGADSGRGDGRVCVGVGHCECDVGLLREAERIVNMKYSSPAAVAVGSSSSPMRAASSELSRSRPRSHGPHIKKLKPHLKILERLPTVNILI
jgi:hypothetical protein